MTSFLSENVVAIVYFKIARTGNGDVPRPRISQSQSQFSSESLAIPSTACLGGAQTSWFSRALPRSWWLLALPSATLLF